MDEVAYLRTVDALDRLIHFRLQLLHQRIVPQPDDRELIFAQFKRAQTALQRLVQVVERSPMPAPEVVIIQNLASEIIKVAEEHLTTAMSLITGGAL
jgi:hypothetical protein